MSKVATAGRINQIFRLNEGSCKIVFEGLQRIRIDSPVQTSPYVLARVYPILETPLRGPVAEALVKSVNAMMKILMFYGHSPLSGSHLPASSSEAGQLADMIVSSLEMPALDKQRFLETLEEMERLQGGHGLLSSRLLRMLL